MGEPGKDTLEQSGFSTDDLKRKAGDVIKSQDWNVLVNEIGRLGTDKVNLNGEQKMSGSLTLAGPLTVLDDGTKESTASLVVQKDMSGALGAELALANKGGGPDTSVAIDFDVGRGVNATEEGNAQIKVTNVGMDNASKMSLSTWDGTGFGERLTIMPDGAVGIGTANPDCELVIQKDAPGALGAEIALVNKSNDADTSVAINFDVGRGVHAKEEGKAQIKVTNLGETGTGEVNTTKMGFSTWDGQSFVEQMSIWPGRPQEGGWVSVGTKSVRSALVVEGQIRCIESITIGEWAGDWAPSSLHVIGDARITDMLVVDGMVYCNQNLEVKGNITCDGNITCVGRVTDAKVRKFINVDHSGAGQRKTELIAAHEEDPTLEEFISLEFESRDDALLRFDFTDSMVDLRGWEAGMAYFKLLVDGESVDDCMEGFGGPLILPRRISLTRILSLKAGLHTLRVDWGIARFPRVPVTGTPELWSFGKVQLSAIEL